MPKYRIAAVPGDGIGKEVIAAGIEVLNALAKRDDKFSFEFESFDWGSDYYKKHGVMTVSYTHLTLPTNSRV